MHRLLTDMSAERMQAVYESLPEVTQRALDGPIGQALHSRPQTVVRRPMGLRVKGLRAHLVRQRDDDLAGEILRGYLLGPHKELVTTFLDAVGVEHEDGAVEDDAAPAEKKVGPAVKALLSKHDEQDVFLYLSVALQQWPDSKALKKALDARQTAASS